MNIYNKHYTIYDSKGEISRCINCSESMRRLQKRQNEFMVEGESDHSLHMVVNGSIVDRPENPAEVSGTSLINVPVPSTMKIGPDTYALTSSTVELDLPLGGTYHIRLESFPYKDKWLKVVK